MVYRVLTVFGTRPEIIKLAPVMRALEQAPDFQAINLCTSQHADLIDNFIETFELRIDQSLDSLRHGQSMSELLARLLPAIEKVLQSRQPDAVLVQGDTLSAFAGALSAHLARVPVVHVEAGLRTYDQERPFPEESLRQMISRLGTFHCAATTGNRQLLLDESIPERRIALTGNPVVDALSYWRDNKVALALAPELLQALAGKSLVLLTAHRRENFGPRLQAYAEAIAAWLTSRPDVVVVLPLHPNPKVAQGLEKLLQLGDQVVVTEPLPYTQFLELMDRAMLVLSDSGGVQEEVASLQRPLMILRESTERPEALELPGVILVGDGAALIRELERFKPVAAQRWPANPFGDGHSAGRIVDALRHWLRASSS